jgi:hypothetical protein
MTTISDVDDLIKINDLIKIKQIKEINIYNNKVDVKL